MDENPKQQAGIKLLVVAFAMALLGLFVLNFLAMGYHQSARAWQGNNRALAHSIALDALNRTPWSNATGKLAVETADQELNETRNRMLAMNPADAFTWGWYSVRLSYHNHLDQRLAHAVRRSYELAPQSLPLARQQSIIAAYHWERATVELRDAWRPWLSLALTDYKPLALAAARNGVETGLCKALTPPHTLETWCKISPEFRRYCGQPHDQVSPKHRIVCRDAGFFPAR